MKRFVTITAICILADLLSPQAHAQCVPGTDPLQVLVGRWVFNAKGFASSLAPIVSPGQFAATIATDQAGNKTGVLSITRTLNQNGQITRLETDAGRYQIFPDCSGGTLTFNLSTGPFAVDFWFADGGSGGGIAAGGGGGGSCRPKLRGGSIVSGVITPFEADPLFNPLTPACPTTCVGPDLQVSNVRLSCVSAPGQSTVKVTVKNVATGNLSTQITDIAAQVQYGNGSQEPIQQFSGGMFTIGPGASVDITLNIKCPVPPRPGSCSDPLGCNSNNNFTVVVGPLLDFARDCNTRDNRISSSF